MRALVSAAALFLFAGSLASFASAQDTVGSKKFRIKFRVDEKTSMVEPVDLWITRDLGRTWMPSRKAGVFVSWGAYEKGQISASVVVPDEGSYGFYAQLKDQLSHEGLPPTSGKRPETLVEVVLAGDPEWVFPQNRDILQGGEWTRLRWSCPEKAFRPDSVSIAFEFGGRFLPAANRLPLTGDYRWKVSPYPTDTDTRIRLRVTDTKGKVRESIVSVTIRKVSPRIIGKIEWISPQENGSIQGGSETTLKWRCTLEAFHKNSVTLSERRADGSWKELADHLPIIHEYSYRAPKNGKQVELRLSAKHVTGRVWDKEASFSIQKPVVTVRDYPKWLSPGSGENVTAGSRINLKWFANHKNFTPETVSVHYWMSGKREQIQSNLPLAGDLDWDVPPVSGRFRLQVTSIDRAGVPRSSYADILAMQKEVPEVASESQLEWIQPKSGSYLISGQHIILQWKVPVDRFRSQSVRLSVSTDGVEYQPLTQYRPLHGTYQWRIPPLTQDRHMWFRLQADSNVGKGEELISKVMVRSIPPVTKPKPKWVFPKVGGEIKGGERVNLQWLASVRDFAPNSVSIDYAYDGHARMTLNGNLPVTGDLDWSVPKQEGNVTLYVRAKDRFGIERESSVRVSVRQPRVILVDRPEWLQPTKGDELIANVLTPLRWRTIEGEYRPKSATIYYSVDESAWQPIVREQRLNGTYLWLAPEEAGGRVSLRLTAERTDGSVQQTDCGPFTLARKSREGQIVRWVQPSEGESIPADSKVVLRWNCPAKGFQPASVVLSSSTDGGATWEPIEQKRPLEGDYVWQVNAPPGSDVTLRASVLETNGRERETFVHTKVIQSMAIRPEWQQPGVGDEVPAGAAKILRWHTPKEGFEADSVSIFASVDGGPEDLVGKVLPLSSSQWYQIPDEEGGRLRLRLVARTTKGREVEAVLEDLQIKTSAQKLLSWIHPRQSAIWKGGDTVQLQWTSLRGDLREKSAHLYYSVDGGSWTLITRGLEPTAFYFWTVPWRNGAQVSLKVTARTRAGTEVEAMSPVMTVEASQRPDIAMAKRHADRARIYAAQNRTAQASHEYEKALAIWSDYPEALNDLGTVYAREKQYAKALEFFLRAKKSAPSTPVAYVNAASMEIQLGLSGDALEDLRDAVELGLDQNHRLAMQAAERLWQLSKLYQISGETERSEEACGLLLRIRMADRRLRRQAEEALTGSGGQ